MALISYAQNQEDILLWRALADVEKGFYVDVGAHHPTDDSVTKLFYDQGWCGINIEPLDDFYIALQQDRSRDYNFKYCISNTPSKETFYKVIHPAGYGLSTLDKEIALEYQSQGLRLQIYKVEVKTLDSVLSEFKIDVIHFLKIDVENFERQVLESVNFSRYRPWIVMVEAISPLTHKYSYQSWEDILVNNNYKFVFFDGLNRYYLAKEQYDRLQCSFDYPVCVLDDFQSIQFHNLIERENKLERKLSERERELFERECELFEKKADNNRQRE